MAASFFTTQAYKELQQKASLQGHTLYCFQKKDINRIRKSPSNYDIAAQC